MTATIAPAIRPSARVICAALLVAASIPLRAADGRLGVTFFDVGQGDATLVSCPEGKHHLLIDSGDNRYPGSAAHFRASLTNAFSGKPRHLDVVVASHVHSDHVGSMEWVLQNFQVDTFIDNGDRSEASTYARLLTERRKQVKAGTLNYINAKQADFAEVEFCSSVRLEIFEPWVRKPGLSDPNDRSVAVRLEYKGRAFLFVGDMEDKAEAVMLNTYTAAERAKINADLIKVGHHGSDTSSTVAFINAVSPEIAIVSVGKRGIGTNVIFKHPRISTVRNYDDWFKNHPPPVTADSSQIWAYDGNAWRQQPRPRGMWLTVKDGSVTVTWDGHDWTVN